MVILGVVSKIFGIICIAASLIIGGVGFAAMNENEEYFSAIMLGLLAILLFGAGVHFFGPVV